MLFDIVHSVYHSFERGQTDREVENKIKVLFSNDWQTQISRQHMPLTILGRRAYGTLVKDRLSSQRRKFHKI